VGMAQAPVPKAGTPTVAACSGAAPDGTYYVTMAWVNQAGEEGTPADATAMTISSSTFLVQPSAEQFPAPQNVTGWNIYVGPDPDHMTQQNAVPVPKGDSWIQPNGILDSGKRPGQGQRPSYKQPIPRVIQRG
jgi:hypothetical protein